MFYDLTRTTEQNPAPVKKTKDKFGENPGEQVPWGYDGVYIFAQAIQAGATKETLPQYLTKVDYQGVTGHITFDAKNQVQGIQGDVEVVKDRKFAIYGK